MKVLKKIFKAFMCLVQIGLLAAAGFYSMIAWNVNLESYILHERLEEFDRVLAKQVQVGQIIESESCWRDSAVAYQGQLKWTHARMVYWEREYQRLQREMYHFFRTLESVDKEALEATHKRITNPSFFDRFFRAEK